MSSNRTAASYKAFKAGVAVILEVTYKYKLKEIQDRCNNFLKAVQQRDGKIYSTLYVSNKGYVVPIFMCILKQNLKIGLFYATGKDAYVLTRKEEPVLHDMLVQTDAEIKYLKQFYAILSNKYDEGNICVNFLPKILFQHFKFVEVGKTPDDLEECDKENFKKFYELLQKNAAMSLLLGENNAV